MRPLNIVVWHAHPLMPVLPCNMYRYWLIDQCLCFHLRAVTLSKCLCLLLLRIVQIYTHIYIYIYVYISQNDYFGMTTSGSCQVASGSLPAAELFFPQLAQEMCAGHLEISPSFDQQWHHFRTIHLERKLRGAMARWGWTWQKPSKTPVLLRCLVNSQCRQSILYPE